MDADLEVDVAETLECKRGLLPYLPELLKDLWALGSSVHQIVQLLRPLGLPARDTRVLDLGCGKGAVSILLAEELGFRAKGVDGFAPFLREAEGKAREHGVAQLCDFQLGDMRVAVESEQGFDVVIYASVEGVLGTFSDSVAKMRKTLRPQGYMVIDDGFLKKGHSLSRKGYGHYAPRKETLKQLKSHGDRVVKEMSTEAQTAQINAEYLDVITKQARELKALRPDLTDLLEEYVQSQQQECEVIDEYISGAMWLVQKGI
jgi:cyclopropane fatty-acyl-phospholipid synthase-like methyltransferase